MPVGAAVGQVAPAKELVAAPFTLADTVEIAPPESPSASPTSVTLSAPETLDVARGAEIGTTVSLTNRGDRAITLLFRPDMLTFTVSGSAGSIPCGMPRQIASPIRELFSTIAPKAKADTGVLLTARCPAGTFDEPGVYRIVSHLDTSGASGRPTVSRPGTVRPRRGHRPFFVSEPHGRQALCFDRPSTEVARRGGETLLPKRTHRPIPRG